MTLNMLANMSPSMAGGDEWAGKYAKNLNRAQRNRHRRSARTVVPSNHAKALAFAAARALGQKTEGGMRNMECELRVAERKPDAPLSTVWLSDGVVDDHSRNPNSGQYAPKNCIAPPVGLTSMRNRTLPTQKEGMQPLPR